MRRILAVLLLLCAALTAAPATAAVPTCGGKKATMVFGDGRDVVRGTRGDDVIVLGGGSDSFQSDRGGDDLVCGGPGEDFILLGADRDKAWGGTGPDTFFDEDGERDARDVFDGGPGADRMFFLSDGVHLDLGAGREIGREDDRFSSIEQFVGTTGDDVVVGSTGDDEFIGLGGGSDRLELGQGDDVAHITGTGPVDTGDGNDQVTVWNAGSPAISLGAGDDALLVGVSSPRADGGAGTDVIEFDFEQEGVTLDLAAGTAVQETYGPFGVLGFENTDGSRGDDLIYGDDGPNILDASWGTDTVDGRGGDDVCLGAEVVVSC